MAKNTACCIWCHAHLNHCTAVANLWIVSNWLKWLAYHLWMWSVVVDVLCICTEMFAFIHFSTCFSFSDCIISSSYVPNASRQTIIQHPVYIHSYIYKNSSRSEGIAFLKIQLLLHLEFLWFILITGIVELLRSSTSFLLLQLSFVW